MSKARLKEESMQPSKVRDNLRTKILGRAILYFRELTSTNDITKELAIRGFREGTVVVAETQTRGKGRIRREWMSPERGLWFSIILKPKVQPKHAPKLTLLASVAVTKTINQLYGLHAQVKWPNDVLINRKKVCGILTESQIKGGTLDFAVLGIGVNADFDVEVLSTPLRETATTLKEELGKEIERETLLRELLEEIESYYELFQKAEFDSILKDWRRLAGFLGSYVKIEDEAEAIEGRAIDVDDDGVLIIRLLDKTLRKVASGDLVEIARSDYPEYIDE